MRKPRSDSVLLNLPEDLQRDVFKWIRHMGYEDARLKLIKEHNVKVSIGAMANAYKTWSQQDSQNRILQAVTGADAILDAAAENLPRIDQAMEAALKQAAFEAALTGDNETIKTLVNLVLKFRTAEQDDRKIALQERRLKQAEEAEAVTKDEQLTPEQRDARMKEIFGL